MIAVVSVAICGKICIKALRQLQLLDKANPDVVVPLLSVVKIVVETTVVENKVVVTEDSVVLLAPLTVEVVPDVGLTVVVTCVVGTMPTTCHPNLPGPKFPLKFIVEPGVLEETEKRFQYPIAPLPPAVSTVSAILPARFATPM